MDTVLGLSLTSNEVGWVLVEGRDADGTIVDHADFPIRTGGAARAAKSAERATAAVLQARELATRHDQRLQLIGVTWSDDASAAAALLLESLTVAGLDNVVPIRGLHAAEMLAQGIAPVVGYDRTAVCVLDGDSTTVATVDGAGDHIHTATAVLQGGTERLRDWLAAKFDKGAWCPSGVVVVASDHDLDALAVQLEKVLPVPVFTQSGAQLALARGAALAAAQSTQFGDAPALDSTDRVDAGRLPSRSRSYAGALTMLAGGAVTLVASLSLAVGPRLLPDRSPAPVHQALHSSVSSPVVEAPAPPTPVAAPAPVAVPAPVAAPAPQAEPQPAEAPPVQQQSGVALEPPAEPPADLPAEPPPPPVVEAPPPPPNPHPLLAKLLERLHGPQADPAPDGPAPAPPPDAGAPAP